MLEFFENFTPFILFLVGYFLAWTPYSIVAMYSAFISEEELHPLLLTLPAIFAKLSIIWCPLLNLYINKNLRYTLISRSNTESNTTNKSQIVSKNTDNSPDLSKLRTFSRKSSKV